MKFPYAYSLIPFSAFILLFSSCTQNSDAQANHNIPEQPVQQQPSQPATPALANQDTADAPAPELKPADAATILARKQVPLLCYHQVRDWKPSDSKVAKDYIVPVARFKEQIKMLADSGYHTILPDQLYDYLTTGKPLPEKPVMITFDDTNLDQFTVAAPELEKYGFKGMFFIMTVSLGRPRYMSKDQVKALSDAGHGIGSHTWDHHNVKKYEGKDWEKQLDKPAKQLESITGKPVTYFAYPFGLWNEAALPHLEQRNIKMAFQLAAKQHQEKPLYTVRRIIASGYWSANSLRQSMVNSF
ncbi:polysaccharide deacetylase family protein [Pontibacter vulgaris]|uniref:polysaccharide deacetylase family protein n=1 Tax=Pontibacter vulgaris TaxID=2905679 RepID=UPI001FA753BB|nr:polysaccharide deacetylase family protein [Pontibacter vulgaris]